MSTFLRHRSRPPQGPGHYSPDGRTWFDEATQRWLPVLHDQETLVVRLEDVNATAWWPGLLATLSSPTGGTYAWFVGHASSGDPRWPTYVIQSDTFPRLRSIPDDVSPEDAWAPGMATALSQLRSRLDAEGWRLVRQGEKPWDLTYVRPRVDWPHD
jgi:hypothetical protein